MMAGEEPFQVGGPQLIAQSLARLVDPLEVRAGPLRHGPLPTGLQVGDGEAEVSQRGVQGVAAGASDRVDEHVEILPRAVVPSPR